MFFIRLVRRLLYLAVILGLIHVWLSRKSYVFDPVNIAAVAKRHALPTTASGTATVNEIRDAFKGIVKELRQFYGPFILPDADLKWLKTSHGGGGAIAICPLHISMTEYVLLFGAAVPSTAHCGRFWANITIVPVTGSLDHWSDRYAATTYTPGQTILFSSGETCVTHYKAGVWAVEYGRGFIPASIPHSLAGFLFQNQDPMLLYHFGDAFLKSSIQQFEFLVANWKEIFKF